MNDKLVKFGKSCDGQNRNIPEFPGGNGENHFKL
jgi:hypothetical protein